MKRDSKSALFSCLVAILFCGLLSGCADGLPAWFTGEPDRTVLDAPTPVERPVEQAKTYPLLSSVPANPKNWISKKERQDDIARMTSERHQAEALQAAAETSSVQTSRESRTSEGSAGSLSAPASSN